MRHFLIPILLFIASLSKAQNPIGVPQVVTFESGTYMGGTQNWDIGQDKTGLMYFANNEGLLSFDGRYWKLYPLPNKTIVRSLGIAKDGKIYVGAQDEIGYFYPNLNGVLKFNSLKSVIPEADRQFSDIWDISIFNDEVFFRSNSKIFHLRDGVIKVYPAVREWEFMGQARGKLYAQDLSKGLLIFSKGTWSIASDSPELKKDIVTGTLDHGRDSVLVTTLRNGFYLLKNGSFEKRTSRDQGWLNKYRIYNTIKVNRNLYAVASYSGGCFIVDGNGKLLQRFSTNEGLYKNSVRSIFMDRNQNLWLGLDDGINFIAFNNAIKYIYPDIDKQTSSYASLIHKNTLYIGTSNGIYTNSIQNAAPDLSYSKKDFKELPNTLGQIWSLKEVNDEVLAGHEEGAIILSGDQARFVYKKPGTWAFDALSPFRPSKYVVAGTYTGLQLIEFDKEFVDRGSISGISETLRFLFHENGYIWASHPYRGIFRFKLSPDRRRIIEKKLYTEKNGLPSLLGNYIAQIKNRVVVATQKGVYEFDDKSQKFKLSGFLTPILKKQVYHYLKEDDNGNIWFISYKKVGVVDFQHGDGDKDYSIVYFPELNSQVVAGFENIYPYNDQNVFIGASRGLIHLNYKNYLKNLKAVDVSISLVRTVGKKDSIIHGGYFLSDNKINLTQAEEKWPALSKQYNSLHFEYSSTLFEQKNNIEFSYMLVGFDNTWSAWSSRSEKDYTNLSKGRYTFKVQSRNNLGGESDPVSYSFTIKPAWYETYFAYFFYLLSFIGLIYLIVQRQKRKHWKQQEYLKNEHQREIEHNENEIVRLQNEKLEAEVNFKNKELATTSMHLAQKAQLLSRIKEELQPAIKSESEQSEDLKKVFRLVNEAERGDSEWQQFSIHFDHVHSDFLKKLKTLFPGLTQNELKLCAYLKMNLTSKEIAQLMSISIRAVEVSRYRLRKKLQIASESNLYDYLLKVTSE